MFFSVKIPSTYPVPFPSSLAPYGSPIHARTRLVSLWFFPVGEHRRQNLPLLSFKRSAFFYHLPLPPLEYTSLHRKDTWISRGWFQLWNFIGKSILCYQRIQLKRRFLFYFYVRSSDDLGIYRISPLTNYGKFCWNDGSRIGIRKRTTNDAKYSMRCLFNLHGKPQDAPTPIWTCLNLCTNGQ